MVLADAAGRAAIWKQALKEWNVIRSKIVDEWRAQGVAKAEAMGRTEGQAAAVVGVLEARFKSVPFDLIKAVPSMHDSARLSIMVALAATTSSLDQFRAEAGL